MDAAGLRALDERFAPVTDADVLVGQLDAEQRVLYASPNTAALFGRPRESLLGLWALDLVHPEDRDATAAWLEGVLGSGRPRRITHRVLREDGLVRWLESSASLQREAGGDRVFIVTRDVTSRELAERARQESEERFQTLFRAAPSPMAVTLLDGTFLDVNESFARACGRPREELIGRQGVQLGMWDRPGLREELVRSIDDSGSLREAEACFRLPDGGLVWARLYAERIVAGGRECLLWQALDVTEQKRAQEELALHREKLEELVAERTRQLAASRDELEQRMQELNASEERYRALAENADDLIGEWNAGGWIVYINRACETTLGWRRGEVVGTRLYHLMHPGDLASGIDLFRRLLATGESYRHTFRLRHRDGGWRCLESNVNRFRSPSGKVRVVAIARDVTEERRMRDRLERSERLASVGTLAAGIAHEINNPVESILLAAQYARRRPADPAVAQALADIVDDARRCGRIVRGVLHFAQRRPADLWLHDLRDVVRGALDLVRREARCRAVALETSFGPEPLPVRLNPTQIEQVVTNVVQNALAHPECTRVRVFVDASPGMARLVVEDDGPGLDDSHRRHAFDPFFTTRREEGGTGLGLSVSHGIVVQHGGTIEIVGERGRGARVVVDLPLADPACPEREADEAGPEREADEEIG